MAAKTQPAAWSGPSRRRVPRFRMLVPLDVTVLRSGIPDTLPGRALNVCERGMGAIIAGELVAGESVGVEIRLSATGDPLRTRATVRYHDKLQYGLEFTAISNEQRNTIRDWAKGIKPSVERGSTTGVLTGKAEPANEGRRQYFRHDGGGGGRRVAKRKSRWKVLLVAAVLGLLAATGVWWRWSRSWAELEPRPGNTQSGSVEKPKARVPPEIMQKLLVHRVEPLYPAEARKQRLQGVIVVNVVVGTDGAVMRMRPLNGPDILAQAAMEALRWWKFEPYRLNGEPAVVETTLAVEFRR
ncbi:MAG TPA: TonB family protein [Candidatus Sulfotelmatobacter sp.]